MRSASELPSLHQAPKVVLQSTRRCGTHSFPQVAEWRESLREANKSSSKRPNTSPAGGVLCTSAHMPLSRSRSRLPSRWPDATNLVHSKTRFLRKTEGIAQAGGESAEN